MYEVKKIDLTNVVAVDTELVQPRRRISEFFFLAFPAGATLQLKVGQQNPLIPISEKFSMEPDAEDENNNGLYWQNDAPQPGVICYMIVGYGKTKLNPILL